MQLTDVVTVTLFQNLVFFNNPPSVTLSQLLEVMSWQFSSYVGRGLNSDQLNMLAEKLTGEGRRAPEGLLASSHASIAESSGDCHALLNAYWMSSGTGPSVFSPFNPRSVPRG